MRLILNSKIGPLQFAVYTGLSSLGFVTMYRGNLSCLSMIVSVLVGFLLLIPCLLLTSKKNFKTPLIIKIIASVFVTLLTVLIVNAYTEFFTSMVNPSAPKWFMSGLLLISAVYPSIKGIEAVSRGALLSSVFVIISIVIMLALLPYGDMAGFSDIDYYFSADKSIDYLLVFSPFLFSIFLYRNINKNISRSILIPFIIIVAVFAIVVCFGKLFSTSEYEYIFYSLSEISSKSMPMGLSGLFIAFSVICIFFAVVYFCHSFKAAANVTNPLASVVFILTVFVLSVITGNIKVLEDIILNRYALAIMYIVISLITPILIIKEEKSSV